MEMRITMTMVVTLIKKDENEDFDYDDSDQKSPGRDKSLQPTFFLHSFDCNLVMGGENLFKAF